MLYYFCRRRASHAPGAVDCDAFRGHCPALSSLLYPSFPNVFSAFNDEQIIAFSATATALMGIIIVSAAQLADH